MEKSEHYKKAESLLEEAEQVVSKIRDLSQSRLSLPTIRDIKSPEFSFNRDAYQALTRQMDELGKKVTGIYAQAQVHATLAGGAR